MITKNHLLLLTLLLAAPTASFGASKFAFVTGLEHFEWTEYRGDGELLLTETGPMGAIGISIDSHNLRKQGALYGINGGFYYGMMEYDGQTQSGIKAYTDVKYKGSKVEGTLGYRYDLWRHLPFVDLYVVGGLEDWERKIYNGTTASGAPVYGYTEHYTVLYGKLGAGLAWNVKQHNQIRIRAEIKRPHSVKEKVDLIKGTTLEPQPRTSTDIRIEYDHLFRSGHHMTFTLYAETWRFGASPQVPAVIDGTPYLVHQPESHADRIGLRTAWNF